MNELKIFESKEFGKVRIATVNDEPWFVASDICKALDIANTTQAVQRLDEDEKSMFNIGLSGGATNCVNEYGLYNLVLASRKKEAKDFKRWITHEVLPTIRKHGAYMTPDKIEEVLLNPDTIIKLATELKEERQQRAKLEAKMEQDKPLVAFAHSVATAKTSILVGELAKLLKQNGINIGQNRLFEWLKENRYLIKRKGSDWNMPTQRSMEMGLFEIKETVISHGDGHTSISKTVKVTGKGQIYFIDLFLSGKAVVE